MSSHSSSPSEPAPFVGTEAEQRLGRDDVATTRLTARDPFELTQLLERIDADVGVRADADPDAARAHALDREKPVTEIGLGRQACADTRAGPRE